MQDRDIQYKYVDVDKIKPREKIQILEFLKYKYQSRVSYPLIYSLLIWVYSNIIHLNMNFKLNRLS